MRRVKLISAVVFLWLIFTSFYAYHYVVRILALPEEYDAYARNWQFQLLAFSIVRLPYLLLLLVIAISAVFLLTRKKS